MDHSPRQTSRLSFPGISVVPSLTLGELNRRAKPFAGVLSVPVFETTAAEIEQSVSNTIRRASLALDHIGSCQHSWVTFGNTVSFFDDIRYEINLTANRYNLLKSVGTNAAIRQAAWAATKQLATWAVSLDYRQNVHQAVRKYASGSPRLRRDKDRLFHEVLHDYQRAGFALPEPARVEIRRRREELAGLVTEFESQLGQARPAVRFTRAELSGVPDALLQRAGVKTGDDEFTIQANSVAHFQMVMDHARLESTRQKLAVAAGSITRDTNGPQLQRIVELRDTMAKQLGYASWADYQIEPWLAQSATNALAFCERSEARMRPAFTEALEELRQLKVQETGDAAAKIHDWDWRYYSNRLRKERYDIDSEALRVYFPYERCMAGMIQMSEEVFGLKFEPVKPPRAWSTGLQLFAVLDAKTDEPVGLIYLDLFSRNGKHDRPSTYPLIDGMLTPGNFYQHPTVALVCSFSPPQSDTPTLLSHQDVESLFHEFGVALQTVLTRARFGRFSTANGLRDFAEAPSQVLENWAWDRRVLDTFAADYRDPSRKIPRKTLARLKEARRVTARIEYQHHLAMAKLDLTLHTQVTADNHRDVIELSNRVLADSFLPPPAGTVPAAAYDAGSYGYVWADMIGMDLATAFKRAVGGAFDTRAGRRLRNEIYARGSSRDANKSIEAFLERKQSAEPFWKTLGLR